MTNGRDSRRQREMLRLEVKVREEDVPLVRAVVGALNDPAREQGVRAELRERYSDATGFKAFLLKAPIEGLDLDLREDVGSNITRGS